MGEQAAALAGDVLARFGSMRLRVHGLSMIPAIRPGDVLSVRAADAGSVRPGQVVLFRRDHRLVAHRALAHHADGRLMTRGDAQRTSDPPVPPSAVLGVVVSVARGRVEFAPPAAAPGPLQALYTFAWCLRDRLATALRTSR